MCPCTQTHTAWAGGPLTILEFFHPSQSAGQSEGQTHFAPLALPMCCNPGAQEQWLQNLTLHLSLSSIRGINFCASIFLVNACLASQATHRHCIPSASALLQVCVLGGKDLTHNQRQKGFILWDHGSTCTHHKKLNGHLTLTERSWHHRREYTMQKSQLDMNMVNMSK